MAASKEALEALHTALANAFADVLKNGLQTVDKETGELIKESVPPAYLNVIRQFLKDNNIESLNVPGSAVANLVARLPYEGNDAVTH